ncbi:endonuclease/exonuclease/phosphatase family protein [Alsobacter sp. SYSU M60028]|uniref:Endonuclease/exonuclease/phosphatase family protein n=1 Tax=Alsobacter ponti TaxID=2962936 RepID=A0ABT1LFW7_9HYPH|nr:endonuclease/exonuclease/phosphatase family protein [Alsobacter ponti]MCP8940329.1 endonuclease/exonuclease/phosphatase family protein [Alsobacter ponti]
MKLITWNIQWGLGADGIMDPARIVAHAREMADFDVLCLQEVAANFPELAGGPGHDQFALIAGLLPGYRAVAFAPLEFDDAQGRPKRFGNALFSRLPVAQALRHTLPWGAAATRNMPRGLVEAVVHAGGAPVRVMTTHLEYSHPALRQAQVEAIRELHRAACAREATPREDGPGTYVRRPGAVSAILCGDFNMRPEDLTLHRLAEPFGDGAPRFVDAWRALNGDAPHPDSACIVDQSFAPPHCCDYVFVTEDIAPRLRRVVYDVDTRVSDHQPVLVELDLS